ncbi:hypothetical protein ABT010_00040 [Streptomyces sp. NPDC002668]|uniref:hypothetical protein n=1 Tax=Streptomyces sp. NPDC002668 TaxID=3154422 RepID=UPI003325035C
MTADLAVDRAAVPPAPTQGNPAPTQGNPAADAWYISPEDAGVMVFTKDDYLSLLEIDSASSEPITVWPQPRFVEH